MMQRLRDPMSRIVLATAGLGLVAIGAIQAMYGPAFPGLMARFGVGVERVGATVQLHFAAGLVATLASSLLLERFGYRRVLVAAGALLAAGALGVAFAPRWGLMLAGVAGAGLGFGLFNVGLNLVVARTFAPNAAPYLNLVSALFGVGAVLGPLAVGAVGGSLRGPFLGLAVTAAATAALALRLSEPPRARPTAAGRFPWAAGIGFVVLFGLYVAVEQGVASWETVHLEPTFGAQRAAFLTGLFWAALTAGRVAAIALAERTRPRTLVLGASTAGLAALATAHVTPFAPAAYVLAGLAFAPVFPTSLAWIERVFPDRSERVVPIALAFANAGPVGATAVIGAWVGRAGPQAVPSALTAIANDYGYDEVFSRQIRGLGRPGDVLVAISTSGNSSNVLAALEAARNLDIATIGMTGMSGGAMEPLCDLCIRAPSGDTPRIQEMHIALGHAICEFVESELA